jgi:hypothetical protein
VVESRNLKVTKPLAFPVGEGGFEIVVKQFQRRMRLELDLVLWRVIKVINNYKVQVEAFQNVAFPQWGRCQNGQHSDG